ncbi:MAG: Coenzyme F420 hydrogenase/dehydrogenase, beta subunit C-terminal domain [Balneolaceae bacterium]|nr:Coenzyme F420 hydrogenase/dehydrogenase, beta subunit C-terminal domain [Balneolaceae bacterium]
MATTICPEEQCTGCAACFNICPQECICMVSDAEGFLRPEIDTGCCDDCGFCKRVCPVLNPLIFNQAAAPEVYACWNRDEKIRFQSASGGAFSAFAGHILDQGGVVFGAAFDNNLVVRHRAVHSSEDLGKLRSSKYVQSHIGHCYKEILNLLRQNRKVLFSGTPCQVAALYAFLGQDNENLMTCDMLCHGVPSPGLFSKYLEYLEKRFHGKLVDINVRHKCKGWGLNSTVAYFSDGRKRVLTGSDNSYMYGFINCLSLRTACYRCPYTSVDRVGDITLADFWGIGDLVPFRHDKRNGISLILVNSEKGRCLFAEGARQLCFEKRTLEEARHKQSKLSGPPAKPKNRRYFYDDYKELEYVELAKKHLVDKGLKGVIKQVMPRSWIFYLQKMRRGKR